MTVTTTLLPVLWLALVPPVAPAEAAADLGAPAPSLPSVRPETPVDPPTVFRVPGVVAPPAADAAGVQDPAEIIARADRALASLKSLRAEFVQRVENPILERVSTGRGTLFYRAPDRFRVAYSEPPGDLVVDDGTHVWIYLPSSQPGQVIRQPAAESGVRNPLTYLRDLRGHYRVAHDGVEEIGGRAADRLTLLPKGSGAPFARLDVWVDRSSGLVRRVRTRTTDGVVTTYTFGRLERNPSLGGDLFAFRVPRGVEVFDQ